MSDLSIQWLIVFVDASLKAALVALVAAAGLALLRVRDSNLRHRVWTGVLCGMILLPALTQIVPAFRLPFTINPEWFAVLNRAGDDGLSEQIADRSSKDTEVSVDEAPSDQRPVPPDVESMASGDSRTLAGRSDWPGAPGRWPGDFPGGPRQALGPFDNALTENSPIPPETETATASVEPEPDVSNEQPAAVPRSLSRVILSRLPLVFWSVWLAGTLALGLRLLAGLWMARALRRASRPIDSSELPASFVMLPTVDGDTNPTRERGSQNIPSLALRVSMPRRSVPVLACPLIRVPLTLGVFRPQILLPLDWIDWPAEKLQAILAHERTHAERGDCAMALLAEVNRCLYWFHPLAWWLRRRLAALAEAACDDAAIGSTGDRASYARHLLEVAATARAHRGRLIAGGVSMARRSNVETRITAILDFRRPLSQRLTWGTVLLLIGVIAPLIALAAALRPSNGSVAVQGNPEFTAEPSPEDAVQNTPDSVQSSEASFQDKPDSTAVAETANSALSTEYSVLSTQPSTRDNSASAKPQSSSDSDVTFTYAGTVVDPDGKPVAGAKIAFDYWRKIPPPDDALPLAVTDAQGTFRFSRRKSDFVESGERGYWTFAGLLATQDGFGFAFGPSVHFETTGQLEAELTGEQRRWMEHESGKKSNVLRLVHDDLPVRGRILTTEGKPVRDAKVEVIGVWGGIDGTLDAWDSAAKERGANYYSARAKLRQLFNGNFVDGPRATVVPVVRTDADGWFTLKGLGRDRIAETFVSGLGIETVMLHVRSRHGDVITLPSSEYNIPRFGSETFYPSEFTRVVGPSLPVEGGITASHTKQPLAGVVIKGYQVATKSSGGSIAAGYIRTVTDAAGRYRLEGLPLGKNKIVLLPPFASRYLAGGATMTTTAGLKPLELDVTLTAGVLVRGRVIDGLTGKPLRGRLDYFAFNTNPYLGEAASFRNAHLPHHYTSDHDGRFAIPVLPGKGILTFDADDHQDYPRGAGADQINGSTEDIAGTTFFSTSPLCLAGDHSLLTSVDPPLGTEELAIDLTLRSGVSFPGRILSPDAQPLTDYYIFGESYAGWYWHPGDVFEVKAYVPQQGRRLMFYHPGRNLVGLHEVTGAPPEKLDVILHPGATLVGRLLDKDGKSLENVWIHDAGTSEPKMEGDRAAQVRERGVLLNRLEGRPTVTDAQGRFELKGIISGLKYSANLGGPEAFGTIFTNVTAKPGETKDLGDVQVKPDGDMAEKPKDSPTAANAAAASSPAKATVPSTANTKPSTESSVPSAQPSVRNNSETAKAESGSIRGRVIDSLGKPVAGAKLYAPRAVRNREKASREHIQLHFVDTTDADGRFAVRLPDKGSAPLYLDETSLVAYREGLAVNWVDIADSERDKPQEIVLQPEQIIRGRLIDTEGRPVAKAKIVVDGLMAPITGRSLDPYLTARRNQPHDAWSKNLKSPAVGLESLFKTESDTGGRFVLPGGSAETIYSIVITADSIVWTSLWVVNRSGFTPEPALDANSKRTPWAMPVLAAPDFTHVCEPGFQIEGRVTTAGERPADRVVINAFTLETIGSFTTGYATAISDTDGRYRLTGLRRGASIRVGFEPDQTSSLLTRSETVNTPAAEERLALDVELKRGILVTGQVVDEATGSGVYGIVSSNALANNEHIKTGAFEGHSGNGCETDANGKFSVTVVPGPAVIKVQPTGGKIRIGDQYLSPFCQPFLSEEERRRTGLGKYDLETFAAANVVNFAPEGGPQSLNLELKRGKTVDISFVDEKGLPVENVFISGVTERWPITAQLTEPRCTVYALSAERPRKVLLLHAQRRLAGSVTLTGEETLPVNVSLVPTGSLRGRAVTAEGTSIGNAEVTLRFDHETVRELYRNESLNSASITTDKDGHFEASNIVADESFAFEMELDQQSLEGQPAKKRTKLTSGQRLDLGDVVFAPPKPEIAPKKPGESKSDMNATSSTEKPAKTAAPGTATSKLSTESSVLSTQSSAGNNSASAKAESILIRGRVVDPDGKPAAGATVRAAVALWAMLKPIVGPDFNPPMSETKADEQGRFSISFPTQPFGDLGQVDERWHEVWKHTTIAASLDGFGPAWVTYDEIDPQQPVTLRLVADLPVRGRVVDLEGRPVSGATVKISGAQTSKDNDISPWIEGIRAGELPWTVHEKASRSVEPRVAGTPTLVTTDANGSFEIRGLGRERIVALSFEGETVAHRTATLVTRKMDTVQRTISAPPFEATESVFGAEFTFTADPARPIEGVVRDAASGEPLAGVAVESDKLVGYPYSNNRILKTKTDKLGKFRLIGMPKGSGNRLLLLPNDEQPYFMREVDVPDPVGLGPAKMEIELHRGIWIGGRVTDKVTGAPVPGVKMYYLPWLSNEYAQKTPEFDAGGHVHGDQWRYVTGPEGKYRLVGLPGPAIVGADSVLQPFRNGIGYDAMTAPKNEQGWFETYRNPINPGPSFPTMMQEINPAADAKEVSLDFALDPGASVKIRVVDRDGAPVTGVAVDGLTKHGFVKASREAVLVAQNFAPKEKRSIILRHEQRKIGRVVMIGPEQLDQGEIAVELQPVAVVVGQLRDSEGSPISGMAIESRVLPFGDFGQRIQSRTTKVDGRFQVILVPGCRYSLVGEGGGLRFVTIAEELSIEPGETKDLGTVTFDKEGKLLRIDPAAKQPPADSKKATVEAEKASATVIRGTILNPDGKPAAKAHVAVIGYRIRPERGGDLSSRSDVMGETTTDDKGRFELKLSGVSSKSHSQAHVIARADDLGLAWRRIDPDARYTDQALDLKTELPIRGRFIDIQGQSAGEMRISLASVSRRSSIEDSAEGLGYYNFAKPPQAWPPSVTADRNGSFAIRGIPPEYGVYLTIAGTDRFAPQDISLNTGAPEQRPENDATYRSLVRNVIPGEEAVLPLPPAQIFEGVVRFADSGEPAPHARLTIWASQQPFAGSMVLVAGTADALGRYRINPHPGVRFGIFAYPPDGAPYLIRRVEDMTHKDGALVKQVDLSLPRGVLVRGRVVESETKAPIAGAMIQYVPERRNNRNATDDVVTGWEGIQLSGADGAFEIAVLPGPGTLLANGPEKHFVFQEFGSQQLDRGVPGGDRNYAHAVQRVNAELKSEPLELILEMRRGATIFGRLTNAAGEPVEHALMMTRLNINPAESFWRGFPVELLGGRFELSGLGEGHEYPVHFLDAKNRLGATVVVKAGDPSPTVVLVPCGQAVATLTDADGNPLADIQPDFEMVVTPGPPRFGPPAMSLTSLTADAAFVANIDRTNYRSGPKSDSDGRITFPALIPGATYRISTFKNGRAAVLKDFVAESQKTLDLGKFVVAAPKEE